jgi:hypothetical protein
MRRPFWVEQIVAATRDGRDSCALLFIDILSIGSVTHIALLQCERNRTAMMHLQRIAAVRLAGAKPRE